ncbi:MAG: ABC transporter ATP-binding protein [Chloroflexia bacterium]|nr:ABC transporter ATP-binding protein [Chloroflexia bacterium]
MVFRTRKGLFRQGAVTAVSGVSVAIGHLETLALVGESGSGKTTVGRISIRLLQPTAGHVLFDGQDITDTPEERLGWLRKRAAIVFQDPFSSLNPYMTVSELIAEPLVIDGELHGNERRTRVRETLAAVDLTPADRFLHKYPSSLSGGQRQRVGIARALIRDPDYMVADEPVSMVDASSRVEILSLLDGLQRQRGVAILYITHDIASARHFADRIAVMHLGSIVETGTARQVIDHPLHPYTRSLIAAVPEPDPANRFRRRATERWADTPGLAIHPACPHDGSTVEAAILLEDANQAGHFVACHLEPSRDR